MKVFMLKQSKHSYKYTVSRATVHIEIKKRSGEVFTCLIDFNDISAIIGYNLSIRTCSGINYVIVSNGARTEQYLHRFLLKPKTGLIVDHRDGNGLNNKRKNLRQVTQQINTFDRHRYTGKLSIRNVSTQRGKYVAHVRHKYLGSFTASKEASTVAERYRLSLNLVENGNIISQEAPLDQKQLT